MVLGKIIRAGKEAVHDFDMFGKSITFTYKGKEEFTTFFGGLISIAIRIVMFLYICLQLNILIMKKDTNTSTNLLVQDLVNDKKAVNIGKTDFSIAVSIESDINLLSDETYVSLEIWSYINYSNGTITETEIATQT